MGGKSKAPPPPVYPSAAPPEREYARNSVHSWIKNNPSDEYILATAALFNNPPPAFNPPVAPWDDCTITSSDDCTDTSSSNSGDNNGY